MKARARMPDERRRHGVLGGRERALIIRPSAVNLGYILRSIPHSSFKMDTISKMSCLDIGSDFLVRSCEDMWNKLCKEGLIPDERR